MGSGGFTAGGFRNPSELATLRVSRAKQTAPAPGHGGRSRVFAVRRLQGPQRRIDFARGWRQIVPMDEQEPPKPFFKRLQEKMAASRFFTFSLLLHIVIVIMGGSVVLFKAYQEPADFEASDGGLVSNEVSAQPPPEQPVDMTQTTFTPEAPQISSPTLTSITTTNVTTPTFQVAAAVPVVKPVQTDAMSKMLDKAAQAMAKGVSGNVPGTMAGRMGGTNRSRMMMEKGGKQKSEEAVMRGLRWLVKNQNADGSWAPEERAAMTGFGILSFLGHGETPTSAEFGPTVQKAIDWMIENGQKYEGRLSMTKDGWGGHGGVYAHGIAAYALGEYYTMTKDERVAPLLKQAIDYIVKGQGPDGGWMYSFDKSQSDTSVSGWQIQALKAAHLSGLNIDGVDAALDKAMLNLKRVQTDSGGFGYRKPEDRPGNAGYALAGVGVLCTYFWKQDKDELVRDGIKFILDNDRPPVKYKSDNADLYAWYYHTQACLMVGGSAWSKWNRMFQDEIADNQSPDGSWPPVETKSPGGLKKPDGYGPFYRTNLCILMLEVFYRYMPTTKG